MQNTFFECSASSKFLMRQKKLPILKPLAGPFLTLSVIYFRLRVHGESDRSCSRWCLLLLSTWSYLIFGGPCCRALVFVFGFWTLITFYSLLTSLFCIQKCVLGYACLNKKQSKGKVLGWFNILRGKIESSMSDKKLNSHSFHFDPPLPLKTKHDECWNYLIDKYDDCIFFSTIYSQMKVCINSFICSLDFS
jgi:hypothetical protein